MIRVTRLNLSPLILNSDLVEHIETTPDTVITLTTGQSLRVRESAEEVVQRIVEFRRSIYGPGVFRRPFRNPPNRAYGNACAVQHESLKHLQAGSALTWRR